MTSNEIIGCRNAAYGKLLIIWKLGDVVKAKIYDITEASGSCMR